MINTSGITRLAFSSLLAGVICLGYWKYREVDVRKQELEQNRQTVEQLRKEVRDLQTRVDQTRARVKALESDHVEAEAVARDIGGAVGSKSETVYHIDESHMTPAAPAPAAPEAAPPISAPAPQQAPPPAKP